MGRQIIAGRAIRQVKLGPSELVDARPLAVTLRPDLAAKWLPLRPGQSPSRLAHVHQWPSSKCTMHFVASNSYASSASNEDRRIYGASWFLFSGDQSLISSFVSVCICALSAQF